MQIMRVLNLSRQRKAALIFLVGGLLLFAFLFLNRPFSDSASGGAANYLGGKTIVIDPGHGGIDGGVSGNGLVEKEINLEVALLLRDFLEKRGAAVKMTRESDRDVSGLVPDGSAARHIRDLYGRGRFINESGADLFISLHVNSCGDPYTRGAIVFHGDDSASQALADILQKSLNRVTKVNPREGEYFHQSSKIGDFYLLNYSSIPGVIVEMGFMTSPGDRELLKDGSYKREIARAVCYGIVRYLVGKEEGRV
ncbi:MAG TPA: N-acetylmuramoyl-L-alanine amidase CwlD [Firmicutes bacterium]|nr:N-acetylmuramoyl-L-alanine amidase CwlD [Bacillota bacterium]